MSIKTLALIVMLALGASGLLAPANAITTFNLTAVPTSGTTFQEDTTYSVNLLNYISGVVGSLTYYVTNSTHVSAVVNSAGTATFTPASNWNGVESLTFNATDTDGTSNTSTVQVTVSSVNDNPYFGASTCASTLNETEAHTCSIAVTDGWSETATSSLTYNCTVSPAGLALTCSATGTGVSLSFAAPTVDNVRIGSYSINVAVKDANAPVGTNSTTFTVNIADKPEYPIFTGLQEFRLKAAQAFDYRLTNNITDNDISESYKFSTPTTPDWTRFSMDQYGRIYFTPTEDDRGKHSVDVKVTDKYGLNATATLSFFVTESCDDGALTFDTFDVDPDELAPGEKTEIKYEVYNSLASKDMENIRVEIWVEDSNGKKLGDKIKSDEFDVEAKDSVEGTLDFTAPFDAKHATYNLFMLAKGDDEDGTEHCRLEAKKLKVSREEDELKIGEIEINPETPACGSSAEVSVTLYNIGRSTEDDVKLKLKNTALGIDQTLPTFELKSTGTDSDVTKKFTINLPGNKTGNYLLEVSAKYNSDKSSTTESKEFTIASCGATPSTTTSTASATTLTLEKSSASASSGEKVKFPVVVKNTGASSTSYTIEVSGASDWATVDTEQASFTLAPNAVTTAYVYLTPKSGKTGDRTATITVKSGGTEVASKGITVSVSESLTTVTGLGHAVPSLPQVDASVYAVVLGIIVLVVIVLAGMKYGGILGGSFGAGTRMSKKVRIIRKDEEDEEEE